MKKLRTRHFHIALYTSLSFSILFLVCFVLIGNKMAETHFTGMSEALLWLFGMAAASFLVFCFVPYFRGDHRWYSVSTILTLAFCIGSALLWQMSGTVVV
jgi:hypothetical protein